MSLRKAQETMHLVTEMLYDLRGKLVILYNKNAQVLGDHAHRIIMHKLTNKGLLPADSRERETAEGRCRDKLGK